MSAWVYLLGDPIEVSCVCECCGNEHKVMRTPDLWERNITSNLCKMAKEAGIDDHIFDPQDIGVTKAKQLIEPLKKALTDLHERPLHYNQFDASNGWGRREHLIDFVQDYLKACIDEPDANVKVNR